MSWFEKVFIGVLLAVESYYWIWWLPRNWKNVEDCRNIYFYLHRKKPSK